MTELFGTFCPGPRVRRAGAATGPLARLRFAAKDLIDIAGHVTGGGNPDWAATHAPAAEDAPVVTQLCMAGATLAGKTITDELAFGLDGRNAHFGTPINAAAPDRLPGGSSSGSAAAVAGGLVDFAIGTDTGGSVRVPASFCGLFGFRPTHGAVSARGVTPFAPSFDTVGWFAQDARVLRAVGEVLLPEAPPVVLPGQAALCQDAFALADPAPRECLVQAATAACTARGLKLRDPCVLTNDNLASWTETYRALQGAEIRATLGPWIRTVEPCFGRNVAPRFASIWDITVDEVAAAQPRRASALAQLDAVLQETILILPTTPFPAPLREIDEAELGLLYPRMLALGAPASLAGLPQVTLPLAATPHGPLGLSLLGPRNSDRTLLALAAAIDSAMR